MAVKPTKVLCARCRKSARLSDPVCTDCGGRVIKICGACSWELSAAKKYCDSCGEPQLSARTPSPLDSDHTPIPPKLTPKTPLPHKLDEPAPEAPAREEQREQPRPQRPPLPEDDRPRTMRRRSEPPRERPPEKAPAKREEPAPRRQPAAKPAKSADPADRFRRPDDPRRRGGPGPTPSEIRRRPTAASLILPMLLLLLGGGLYAFWRLSKNTPARMLDKAAGGYLAALKAKDYPAAHALLSAAARDSLSVDEFAALADDRGWSYSGLKIKDLQQDHALVVYTLKVNGEKTEDWMHFVRENGKWRRAYWWGLQPELERALGAEEGERALELARRAVQINPYAPTAYGYLCEAAYAAGGGEVAEPCAKALSLSQTYPSRLGPDGLFRVRAILADHWRNTAEEPARALEIYDRLLGYPRLPPDKHCALLLAKADLQVELGDVEGAVRELKAVGETCRGEEDRAHVLRALRVLTGQALVEAVQAVQGYRMPGDEDTLLEWRKKARVDLARRLKTGAPGPYDEDWQAVYKEKGAYEVVVRYAGRDMLTAAVDLWTHTIKVKIAH